LKNKPVGHSYNDPIYDDYEAGLEKKYGLPAGGMRAIRTKGERSNADQVSPVGASTVYQIMPHTRDLFLKKYGIDAYAGPQQAAEVSALHLRDDMRRTGSWEGAVTAYIGGPDKSKHGAQTAAYTARVTGKPVIRQVTQRGATALSPGVSMDDIDWLNTTPDSLGSRRPLGPNLTDKPDKVDKRAAHVAALLGPDGMPAARTPGNTGDLSDVEATSAADAAKGAENAKHGFIDRTLAAVDDNFILNKLIRSMDTNKYPENPEFHKQFLAGYEQIEGWAQSQDEMDRMFEATSFDHLMAIQQDIEAGRTRDAIKNSNGTGWAFDLATNLVDPAGWVAAAGAGKLVQGFGIANKVAAGAVDGLAGNLAVTAALDASGGDIHARDYVIDGIIGMGAGAALTGLRTTKEFAGMVREAQVAERGLQDRAIANLGPDAAPQAVTQEVNRLRQAEHRDLVQASLAPIPDNEMLLSADAEAALTRSADKRKDVETRHNLHQMPDDAERGLSAEMIARAEAIDSANPITAGTKTVLARIGQESTGLRLLNSESVVMRAVGRVLLEGTTGAGGRRRTAAMSKAVRERLYMQEVSEYDTMADLFRKSEGKGRLQELWSQDARREFDRRVAAEVQAREGTVPGKTFDDHAAVQRAADAVERGFEKMRLEQIAAGTVGHARLPGTSRGYLPRLLDVKAVIRLKETPKAYARVVEVLEGQFRELNDYSFINKAGEVETKAYDAAFAKKMAKQYLDRAIKKGNGTYDVPFNVHSPEGAAIVRDTLEALRIDPEDIEKIMGKYSRGGAAHTKARLTLDLDADIGDGKKLSDLFVSDVIGRYRSYARRVSGEVALAQHGIMGKHGLKQLRRAAEVTGASPDDLKALDQVSAEFLNEPFGSHNHIAMDNLRVATSAARLGSMAITQFAETANALPAIGFQRALASIPALPRMMKVVRAKAAGSSAERDMLTDLETLGGNIGMDDYQLQRMFDVKDNDIQIYNQERVGVFSRALRGAGHLQAVASGHRILVASQTRGMAEQIVRKAVGYIKSGKSDKALTDMGFTPEVRAAFLADMDNIATFKNGKLVDLDLRKSTMDAHHMMSFRDAVERGASQIIQRTYIGETGAWAHDGLLKLLFQFRTFSLTSVEKQWGRNVTNHGAVASFAYLMGAMSFAVPIHLARVQLKAQNMEADKRKQFIDEQLDPMAIGRATLNYASSSGVLGDILDIGTSAAAGWGILDKETIPFAGGRGQGKGQLIGGVVAPSVGLAQDLYEGVLGNPKKLVKALPGANLPYMVPLVTGVGTAIDAAGDD
jgi:hypothetical protein